MYVQGGHYAAWADFLERWGAGESLEPAILPALEPADFHADSWERLSGRIFDALVRRLKTWSEALTRELGNPDEFAAARALNHARWSLVSIRALAGAQALPEEVRARLTEMVDAQIRSGQRQLDESVERLRRSGAPRAAVEARLRTIRGNPLTAVTERSNGHVARDAWAADPLATPRRRVIVD
ncbi:hypothetical protein AB0K35_11470 [Micromonospora sp. NPDC053740]|uniref:hypothetical protein n=1 Tax=Micromonospora sp. NPDC053740 TaxID=3155173 RepID=UPI00341A7913